MAQKSLSNSSLAGRQVPWPPPPVVMRPQEFIDFVKIIESDASAMAKVIKALISYNSQCFAAISKLNAKFLEIKKEHTQSRKVPARSRAKGRK